MPRLNSQVLRCEGRLSILTPRVGHCSLTPHPQLQYPRPCPRSRSAASSVELNACTRQSSAHETEAKRSRSWNTTTDKRGATKQDRFSMSRTELRAQAAVYHEEPGERRHCAERVMKRAWETSAELLVLLVHVEVTVRGPLLHDVMASWTRTRGPGSARPRTP